jgi:hypothetical protein
MNELQKYMLMLQGGYKPQAGAITSDQMQGFKNAGLLNKTVALENQIQDTNNLIGSLNIPKQPIPVPNTANEDLLKKQKKANMFMALGDLLQGKDATAGFTQRQAGFDAQRERAERQAKLQNIVQNSDAIPDSLKEIALAFPDMALKNVFSQSGANNTFERFGVYDATGELIGSVNKADSQRINEIENDPNRTLGQIRSKTLQNENPEKLEYFSVSDANGTRINTVVNPTIEDIQNLNKDNYFLNKLPTPSDRGKGLQDDSTYNALKGQFKGTNKLIDSLSNMSEQFAKNPNSALAIGGGIKFIDKVIQNIDATGSILSGDNYKTMQEKGFVSRNGKDYSSVLKEVSVNTGISQSRIRDLAYLFAASRGQEGRGLSDKDYENALTIVSGGAGAEGKIAVLEDVAERMYGEAINDLDFEIDNLPLDANTDRFERLRGSLGVYKSPYSNVPVSADDILDSLGL